MSGSPATASQAPPDQQDVCCDADDGRHIQREQAVAQQAQRLEEADGAAQQHYIHGQDDGAHRHQGED